VGSHRQFVLLGRHLAQHGIAVLRFDYRGMGDSCGEPRDFRSIHDDLLAAVECLLSQVRPIQDVVLWGLCDGATAAALYAVQDTRISGLILLNPWAPTAQGTARTTLRHYYAKRLTEAAFWRKLVGRQLQWGAVTRSLAHSVATAVQTGATETGAALPERLHRALNAFQGRILIILSGEDYTAREFAALQSQYSHWRELMAQPRVRQAALPQANHTFACARWRDEVAVMCTEWVTSW
jgi:exosortase A-associated hydrolase 1